MNRKADITWHQIVMMILALLLLFVLAYGIWVLKDYMLNELWPKIVSKIRFGG